jgi:hypothetical protein
VAEASGGTDAVEEARFGRLGRAGLVKREDIAVSETTADHGVERGRGHRVVPSRRMIGNHR